MTIRKRKDTGKWTCDFYYNGERIVRTLKFARTKKEAEQAEAVIMNQVFQQAYGFEAKPDKLIENFVVETFLPYSDANKKSFVNDISICRVLVEYFRGRTLRQVTVPLVEEFKQRFLAKPTRQGTKRSLATVNNHLRVLSKIFSLAVDADLIESNPCFRVRKFKPNNRRLRVLSDDEEARLLIWLKDNELVKSIVTIALNTGLRRGELFNLRWPDVDFYRETILVRKTKSSQERFVPLNYMAKELLRSLPQTSEYVFPSPQTGERLTDIKKSFCKAVEMAGIRNFRFHDLRHTFATRLADARTDVFTLKELLGHADIRTTMIYVHATGEASRRAVEKLDGNYRFGDGLATKIGTTGASLPQVVDSNGGWRVT